MSRLLVARHELERMILAEVLEVYLSYTMFLNCGDLIWPP